MPDADDTLDTDLAVFLTDVGVPDLCDVTTWTWCGRPLVAYPAGRGLVVWRAARTAAGPPRTRTA